MTAKVVELRPGQQYLAPVPETRRDRLKDRVEVGRDWMRSGTVERLPVVLVRRSSRYAGEKAAFELGRDCAEYLYR